MRSRRAGSGKLGKDDYPMCEDVSCGKALKTVGCKRALRRPVRVYEGESKWSEENVVNLRPTGGW